MTTGSGGFRSTKFPGNGFQFQAKRCGFAPPPVRPIIHVMLSSTKKAVKVGRFILFVPIVKTQLSESLTAFFLVFSNP
jgi:hypothetical protein